MSPFSATNSLLHKTKEGFKIKPYLGAVFRSINGVYYEAKQDNTGKTPDISGDDWDVYDINDPNS